MSLDNAYNRVPKHTVSSTGMGAPITRERDPQLQKLESDIFSKMNQAIVPHTPKLDIPEVKSIEVQSVGFEQALKELTNGVESLDDKP
jgi:hypothetical protein|tara:strand:+ start:117 stop:380 length:264 start_codon:yes stop_codon:yes gene_type:complete